MKLFILLSAILMASAQATEIQRIDSCQYAQNRIEKIQKEIAQLTSEIIQEEDGEEGYVIPSLSTSGFNCEEVPSRYESLISRREGLMAELKEAEHERERSCPRYERD